MKTIGASLGFFLRHHEDLNYLRRLDEKPDGVLASDWKAAQTVIGLASEQATEVLEVSFGAATKVIATIGRLERVSRRRTTDNHLLLEGNLFERRSRRPELWVGVAIKAGGEGALHLYLAPLRDGRVRARALVERLSNHGVEGVYQGQPPDWPGQRCVVVGRLPIGRGTTLADCQQYASRAASSALVENLAAVLAIANPHR